MGSCCTVPTPSTDASNDATDNNPSVADKPSSEATDAPQHQRVEQHRGYTATYFTRTAAAEAAGASAPPVAEWEWDDSRKMNDRSSADVEPCWRPFDDSQCRVLDSAFSAGQTSVELAAEVAKGHGVRRTGEAEQTYRIGLQHFLQINGVTGFVRRVRRREREHGYPRPWQEHPSERSTHVFVGGLPLHATEGDVVGLFVEQPPDRCDLEPLHGEDWQDGAQAGRRRYCVVSWDSIPPRSDMLARVAAAAIVGGNQVVTVTLRGPRRLWPFLWPSDMLDRSLRSGTTTNGTPWTYSESHSHDSEDNDHDYVFTLGELKVHHSSESNRDWSESKLTVDYKGKEVASDSEVRARAFDGAEKAKYGKEELLAALKEAAALEGVTVDELRAALPVGIERLF